MDIYSVVLAPSAKEDLEEIMQWYADNAPEKLEDFFLLMREAIGSLSSLPERCPFAPENGFWGEEELRQLLFIKFSYPYRIIYTVNSDTVQVLNIRHGSRRFLHEE